MSKHKTFWIIFGCVAFLHLAGIGLTTLGPQRPSFTPAKKQHIVVKNIPLNPVTSIARPPSAVTQTTAISKAPSAPASASPKPSAPLPTPPPAPIIAKAAPQPKPTPPPKTVAQAPKVTPAPVAKKVPAPTPAPKPAVQTITVAKEPPQPPGLSAEKKALIAKAQASLAKVGSTPPTNPSVSPPAFQDLTIEIGEIALGDYGSVTSDYTSLVAGRIQSALTLPEHGKVELKLTLHKSGRVLKAEVTHSASQKNKTYVESHLSKLQFPPFGAFNSQSEEFSFDLTLVNAPR
ncbi:MAG: hypothetical protein WC222_06715 [Parachlamydiales bacterium]|jgi:outer membrane biosynthesis protein TonB